MGWSAVAAVLVLAGGLIATSGIGGGELLLFSVTTLGAGCVAVGTLSRRAATSDAWLLLVAGRTTCLLAKVDRASSGLAGTTQGTDTLVLSSLGYALTAWGLVVLARRLTRVWDRTRWIDAFVVSLGTGLAASAWLVMPNLAADVSGLQRWLVPLIPAIDLLLVLLATRSLLAVQARPWALKALTAALVVQLLGDVAMGWAAPAGLAVPTGLGSIVMATGAILVALAALHPSVAHAPRQVIPWRKLGAVRFTMLVTSFVIPLLALVALAAWREVSSTGAIYLGSGTGLIGVLVLIRVSGLVSYADTLADERHRSRFEALAEHSYDAVAIVGRDGLVTWASPAVTRVFGPSPTALIGQPLDALLGQTTARSLALPLQNLAERGLGATMEIHATLSTEGARERAIEGTATNLIDDPAVDGLVVVVRDVTDRTEMQRQLVQQAFVDPLTGLANRALFIDRTSHALARPSRADGHAPAVLFVDLDDFKEVNDSLGHSQGDELLISVGRRIAESIGPADTAARLGGDEFAVLLEDVDATTATTTAAQILEQLSTPVTIDAYPIAISASIGLAVADAKTDGASILLRSADLAMYEAKRLGKGQVQRFRAELHERELRHFTFRSDLHGALAAGQLHVLYQPIVDMGDDLVIGAEALLRWVHPTQGPISPVDFIPLAESTRDIVPIGLWVLRTACQQLADWNGRLGSLTMDVNVSPVQLLDPTFVDDVRRILAETGVAPGNIVLELTESMLVHDADRARDVLHELRALGVRLAIDDFGTGYSSLAYLQNFPIDIVKIDRSFVNQLTEGGRGRSLARSIVAIAGSLGIETIAEGIETEAQARDLTALNCPQGQGFHYSRPVDPAAFEAVVAAVGSPAAIATR